MCLHSLMDFPVETDIGYKVFRKAREAFSQNGYYHIFFDDNNLKFPNRWYNAFSDIVHGIYYRANEDIEFTYWSGFHLFLTEEDAVSYASTCDVSDRIKLVVKRVKFEDVIMTGIQDDKKVVVAKRMMILPNDTR